MQVRSEAGEEERQRRGQARQGKEEREESREGVGVLVQRLRKSK
jgi:hypothetical protein